MAPRLLAAVAALCGLLAQVAQCTINGSVYRTGDSSWKWTPGVVDKAAVAFGSYTDMAEATNAFGSLSVATNAAFTDAEQMFAAGFLEGALTQARIKQHYDNMEAWLRSNFDNGPIPQKYQDFFNTQEAWGRQLVASNASTFWAAMGLIYDQFDGLQAGYAAAAPAGDQLDTWAFQQLNAIGDFLDLIPALQPHSAFAKPWDWQNMTAEQVMDRVRATTHCSGLFKLTGNFSELFFAHSSWFVFQGTTRIFKHYRINVRTAGVVGQEMSFASYPAYLSSLDDYYTIWSSNLVVIETSNSIFNTSLYDLVKPQSLFAWQRVRLANLLATDGLSWGTTFSQYNSGTYNNAYGVLQVSSFSPGAALLPNTLVLVEQIPGLVVYGDVTQQLELGYFPMFNVPFWPQIYTMSGYSQMVEKHSRPGLPLTLNPIAGISYQLAPRAQIYRRDQGTVADMASFQALMRSNRYKTDPYADGSPWNAICSRGDLAGSPDGCYDTKAGQASWWASKTSSIINGPTRGDGSLPPFSWSQFPDVSHEGLPAVYDFSFGLEAPAWP